MFRTDTVPTAKLNLRISDILFCCTLIDRTPGYSYRFDLSTSTNELGVTIYHHTKGESIKRVKIHEKIRFSAAGPGEMEQFKALEEKLLDFSGKIKSM